LVAYHAFFLIIQKWKINTNREGEISVAFGDSLFHVGNLKAIEVVGSTEVRADSCKTYATFPGHACDDRSTENAAGCLPFDNYPVIETQVPIARRDSFSARKVAGAHFGVVLVSTLVCDI